MLLAIRIVLILALPFCVIWAYVQTFLAEISRAPGYAWLAARGEIETFRTVWRDLPGRLRKNREGNLDA